MRRIFPLLLAYFCSGFAALVYEVVWTRELVHVLGASLYAVSIVTGLFVGGLAIGAAGGGIVVRKNAGRGARWFLTVYAVLQVMVALCGVCVPMIFGANVVAQLLGAAHGGVETAFLVRAAFAAIVVLPITAVMGATFPFMVASWGDEGGRGAERLYAANTVGAALGAVVCGFWLMPALGLQMSSVVAAGVDLVAAVVAGLVAVGSGVGPDGTIAEGTTVGGEPRYEIPRLHLQDQRQVDRKPRHDMPRLHLPDGGSGTDVGRLKGSGLALLAGVLAAGQQVAAARLLMLVIGSSVYSVSAVLALSLVGIACGALLVVRALERFKLPLLFASAALFIAAIYTSVLMYACNELPWFFIEVARGCAAMMQSNAFLAAIFARLVVAAVVVLVPATALGAVLPLMFQAASKSDESSENAVIGARLFAINGFGFVAGAFATGLFLLPALSTVAVSGIQMTFLIVALVELLVACFACSIWMKTFVGDNETRSIINGVIVFLAVCVIADIAVFRPEWNTAIMSAGAGFYSAEDMRNVTRHAFLNAVGGTGIGAENAPVLFYRDGLNSTITVQQNRKQNVVFLKNDGKVEAALPINAEQPAPTADVATHEALARLPMRALGGTAGDVLVIGYGSGTTTAALLTEPHVERIRVAELEHAVYSAAKYFTPTFVTGFMPAKVPQTANLETIDGRYALAVSDRKFDAIVCQPSDPWVNGSSELFSLEFWNLAHSRMTERGVLSQWIQLYSITPKYFGVLCRTFLAAFPNAVLYHANDAGECILLGFADPSAAATFSRTFPLSPGASIVDSRGIKDMCEKLAQSTGEGRVNTDDNLIVEFGVATGALTQEQRIGENIEWIKGTRH